MKITWVLKDINEANAILTVLGKLPFEQVAELLERLCLQTRDQVSAEAPVQPAAMKSGPTKVFAS